MRVAVVVAGIIAVGSVVVANPRPGKVVRVERRTAKKKVDIAVCEARSSRITCYGPVETGDDLHGLDEKGGYHQLQVKTVVPHPDDNCKIGLPVLVTAKQIRGGRTGSGNQLALRGVDARPGASKLLDKSSVKPDPRPGEQVLLAVDLRGDGVAEIAATMRPCNDVRAKTPGLAGRNGHSFCITFWKRERSTRPWREANQIALHMCQ